MNIESINASVRVSRARRLRALAGLVAAAVVLVSAVLAHDARAQGTGFTGEIWYGGFAFSSLQYAYAPENHSYGFNSATNIGSTNGYVGAGIQNLDNGNTAAWAVGYNLVRVCVHGTYPNCIDTDGWTGAAFIQNNQQATLTIQGHGVY